MGIHQTIFMKDLEKLFGFAETIGLEVDEYLQDDISYYYGLEKGISPYAYERTVVYIFEKFRKKNG